MNKLHILAIAAALIAGLASGFYSGQHTRKSGGAYFCCDAKDVCVLSPSGDCTTPVQWCRQTRDVDGTITCAVW